MTTTWSEYEEVVEVGSQTSSDSKDWTDFVLHIEVVLPLLRVLQDYL